MNETAEGFPLTESPIDPLSPQAAAGFNRPAAAANAA
jgi:hypothetical protein